MRKLVPASTDLALFLAPLLGCLLLGCDRWESSPGIDTDLAAFVESEPLPATQRPQVVFDVDSLDAQFFWISFGEPRDCPSGCFYSKAYGLAFRDRIGWMRLDAYGRDDSVQTRVTDFDIQPQDKVLFREGLRQRFRQVQAETDNSYAHAAYDHFLELLGRDADTPSETLLALARVLEDQYRPGLGRALLENAVVRSSKPILTVLAGLPDRSGYRTIRGQAQVLLDRLSDERSIPA